MLNSMRIKKTRRAAPVLPYTIFVTPIAASLLAFLAVFSVSGQAAAGSLLGSFQAGSASGTGAGSGGSVPVSGFSSLPPAFSAQLAALRDGVYNNAEPREILQQGQMLLASLPQNETELAASRIEYFIARSFKEHGDKKSAVLHFEAALEYAKKSMPAGETAEGLMAMTRALSELCLLKDMAFLISNGPKISQYTKKILSLDPSHVGALITSAASKAYPPPIFGGNPRQAIAELTALLKAKPEGFARDDLFDIRACLGTAYEKLGQKSDAVFWFSKAQELYPNNSYAREELEKLKQ